MKVFTVLGTGLFLQFVHGLAVHQRQIDIPGVISAPVWRRDASHSVENDITRRDHLLKRQVSNTVPLTLENAPSKLLYFANSNPFLSMLLI
jgi:hypothetical protein